MGSTLRAQSDHRQDKQAGQQQSQNIPLTGKAHRHDLADQYLLDHGYKSDSARVGAHQLGDIEELHERVHHGPGRRGGSPGCSSAGFAASWLIQARMASAIARIYGHDLGSEAVRTWPWPRWWAIVRRMSTNRYAKTRRWLNHLVMVAGALSGFCNAAHGQETAATAAPAVDRRARIGIGDLPESEALPGVISAPRPEYPYELRRLRVTGSGVCEITIDPAGRITKAVMSASTGNDILDRNTVFALRRWRFSAGEPRTLRVPIRFTTAGPELRPVQGRD